MINTILILAGVLFFAMEALTFLVPSYWENQERMIIRKKIDTAYVIWAILVGIFWSWKWLILFALITLAINAYGYYKSNFHDFDDYYKKGAYLSTKSKRIIRADAFVSLIFISLFII